MTRPDASPDNSGPSPIRVESPENAKVKEDDEPKEESPKEAATAAAATATMPAPAAVQQMDHFLRVKELVRAAIAAKHTFTIHGRARLIRECLLARGWCEKFHKKTGNVGTYMVVAAYRNDSDGIG